MSSPFKRNPVPGSDVDSGYLSSRSNIWKNGPHYDAATRNPAWIQIKGNGQSIPVNTNTFNDTYAPTSQFKIKPILKEAIIRHGGDFGLIIELEATIQCHTKSDFLSIERAFLWPGTTLSVTFGYSTPRKSGYTGGRTISGFRVATYGFSTTSEGYWVASFKACAPSEAMKTLNMAIRAKDAADRGLTYMVGDKRYAVTGLTELMAYDTQINGSMSIDQLADGQVIIPEGGKGAIVVYHPDHLYKNFVASATGFLSKHNVFGMGGNQVTESENIPYYTLQYVIDRLIMDQAKKSANANCGSDSADFAKVKIKFHPQYSFSYPDFEIISGRPTEVLILGGTKGDYKNNNGDGKNFDEVQGDLSKVSAWEGRIRNRAKINHKKILIERSIIVGALGPNKITDATADKTDPKKLDEGVINVESFLDNIFQVISIATGGMIKLRLMQNPDLHDQIGLGTSENELIIVDENNGYLPGEIKCYVLDPIDGDGSTRTCQVTTNVGSKEYQGSLFEGSMKKSDPLYEGIGKMNEGNNEGRLGERTSAVLDMHSIVKAPGALGASQFDNVHMESLVALLGSVRLGAIDGKQFDMLVYPGVGIDAELDGIYGFVPGNAIMTTQMPPSYFQAKSYFFISTVEHIFSGDSSDWSTKIQGQLSFHNSVSYIYL